MRKASIKLQELRRKIYSKAKAEKGWRRWSREDIYVISTRKQPQADRCICFVAKRPGKPYEGKPHVRFEVAGDGEVLWRT
jgi:hypothetical protein